jgi:hypothetical protein
LDAESGMSLIELLVAMLGAIVVIGALLAILEFSLTQETRISDRVQANRIGRVTMARIVDELHSSCTLYSTAIQAPSTTPTAPLAKVGPTDLWFLSGYGTPTSGNAAPSTVNEHDIHWSSTGNTLTDYAFKSEAGGTPGVWTFPELKIANATATVLAKNLIPPTIAGKSAIFQYSKFATPTSGELVVFEPALATATEAARVAISFTQDPESGSTAKGHGAPFNAAVVLRFSPTETGAESKNEPCT